MWRCGVVLLVAVAVAMVLSGCPKKTPPEGTGTAPPPAPPTTTAAAAITYKCPMHEAVTSDSPGRCTEEGCEMFLVADVEEGQQVEYYCSMPDMHPEEQVSSEPGQCPECGMFMKARIVEEADDEGDDSDENGDENGDEDSEDDDDEEE